MSPLSIFLVGAIVSALSLGGLYFTISEMKRLGRDFDGRADVPRREAQR